MCTAPKAGAAKVRRQDVKYVLLIYNNLATYESWSEQERAALFGEVDTIMQELTASGELVGTEALADTSQAKTVRVRDGNMLLTHGPFADSGEKMAAYELIECASMDEAIRVASLHPMARAATVEVRPIWAELAR